MFVEMITTMMMVKHGIKILILLENELLVFFFIQSFVSKILFGPVFIFEETIPIIKPRLDAKFAYSKGFFFDVNLSSENYRCNKDTKHFLKFL